MRVEKVGFQLFESSVFDDVGILALFFVVPFLLSAHGGVVRVMFGFEIGCFVWWCMVLESPKCVQEMEESRDV